MPDERQQVSSLVERLGAWVVQQPEYPYLFLADHARRKRAATIVAKRLMLLPVQPPETEYANRKERRDYNARVTGAIGQVRTNLSRKRERMQAKAERDRRRFRRLSMLRLMELAEAEDVQRTERLHQEAIDMDLARDLRLAMEADAEATADTALD